MPTRLLDLLAAPGLMPVGACLGWLPLLLWLQAGADAAIGAASLGLAAALLGAARHRPDMAPRRALRLLAGFILAGGASHLLMLWALWQPEHALLGLARAAIAAAMTGAALLAWPLLRDTFAAPPRAPLETPAGRIAADPAGAGEPLRGTEESLRLLVDGLTNTALFMLDAEGRVASWNTGAERIKGYRAEEIIGQPYAVFYPEEDRAAGVPERALAQAAREGRYEVEGWRVRKDGTRFCGHVVIHPLRDPKSGALLGFVKLTRDMTEQRAAAEALQQAQDALAQSQKMETVGQLTGGIAHDFNNLLTPIVGGATLLERRSGPGLDAETRRMLGAIREAALRAAQLTQRLLAFSRRQALAPRPTDCNRLVSGMSELLRRSLGEQVAIETVLAGGLWPCLVDPNQLENVLLNLAVNARDAMPEGGCLTIETANAHLDEAYAAARSEVTPGQYVMIAVSDSGAGMPPEVLARAFEPFFTTKTEGRGTGLGLSQVYGFVKQSRGHVAIYSEPGQGTTVKVYLPRHAGDAEPLGRQPEPTDAETPHGRGETVLLVEDHEEVRAYAARALIHLGYRVVEAPDRAAALRALGPESEVALLFTDVGLPNGMNGRRLADEAVRRSPGLRVLFTTAYARNAISHHGVLEPGVQVLPKPYTVEALARKLRQVLDAAPGE